MRNFNKAEILDLLERGAYLALDNPGQAVYVEFVRLNVHIEFILEDDDKKDSVFVEALAGIALSDLERYLSGKEPRFGTTIRPVCSLTLRG